MGWVSDIFINYIMKNGLLGEIRNLETEISVPNPDAKSQDIRIVIKAEHISVRVLKDEDKKE